MLMSVLSVTLSVDEELDSEEEEAAELRGKKHVHRPVAHLPRLTPPFNRMHVFERKLHCWRKIAKEETSLMMMAASMRLWRTNDSEWPRST